MSFLQEILNTGAPISYVILGGFLIATFLFFHRFFYLHRINIDSENFLLGIKNNLRNAQDKRRIEAISICADTHSPIAAVAREILSRYTHSEAAMRHAADGAATTEIPRLQRNASLIAAIGQLSPLLGLFGTVISIMSMFQKLGGGQEGVSLSIQSIATHLRAALITTALGISAGMVIHLYNVILMERCRVIVFSMEKVAAELISFLAEPEDLAQEMNAALLEPSNGGKGESKG
ncbi:MAG: MotA/TolQ/ExbB proton channel family protein [Victivallales bacterium]|nr:MotA/TolQ/ExbB proton channel family protein [Victivallales bacterium]